MSKYTFVARLLLSSFCATTLYAVTPAIAATTPATASKSALEQPLNGKLFSAQTFKLKNGLQVVVLPNHRAPVVTSMVWYKVGASDEKAGKSGLAHFLEHLMFKGSAHVPPGAFARRVRAMGGQDNAFTAADFTAYYETVAVSKLPAVMKMEADRMQSILLPPDQFESERQVVLEERRMRNEDNPQSAFYDQLRYTLFPGNPYGRPVIGWKKEIEGLTIADARAWHDHWYTPSNAILVVAGDITAAQLKPMVEKIYGPIPSHPVTRPALPPVNAYPGRAVLTLKDPRVHQSEFIRLYRVPSFTENKQDALALDVLQEIMGDGSSTRLYQALAVDQKIAADAGMSYDDAARGPAVLSVTVTPADGYTPQDAAKAYDEQIQKLADKGVTADELQSAKNRLRDSLAYARDSMTEPANIVGEALAEGYTLDDIENWCNDIDKVTAKQVQDAAKKYLLPAAPGANPNDVTGYILAAKHKPGESEPAPSMPVQEIR